MEINQGKLDLSKMRDLIQLKKCGIDLSTTSDKVAILWDAIMFQMNGFFDAPETNGIEGALQSIQSIDPEFPFSYFLSLCFSSEDFESHLAKLKLELKNQYLNKGDGRKWTMYEKLHLKALVYKFDGYDDLAAEIWLDQLVQYPQDLLALKNLSMHYIITGNTVEISKPFTLCRREMSTQDVFYPFILGYEAFGLEERGLLDQAMRFANESLEIYPWNSWATHTVAHIFDANGQSANGINFMDCTKSQWLPSAMLASHNIWHTGLLNLDLGETVTALNIWDSEIIPRLKTQYSPFGMSDAVALLTRIELENHNGTNGKNDIDLTDRWIELSASIGSTLESYSNIDFYDCHLAFAMMCCGKPKVLERFNDRCNDWVSNYENRIFEEWECNSFVTLYQNNNLPSSRFISTSHRMIPLIESLASFQSRDYQEAVNILYPRRKDLIKCGGSFAQNDIFYQFLACALLNAGGTVNLARLKMLFLERKEVNKFVGYYRRLENKMLDLH